MGLKPWSENIHDILNYVEVNVKSKEFSWSEVTRTIIDLFEAEQSQSLANNERKIDCKVGCWNCCCHWVEDVYFFEGIALYEYIVKYYPDRVESIIEDCRASERIMENLYINNPNYDELELLQEFYKAQQPCPLLNSQGECIAYVVRPITCRSFFSEDRDHYCIDTNTDEKSGTYMIGPKSNIEDLLDDLHLEYSENNTTSLRSLLIEIEKNKKML